MPIDSISKPSGALLHYQMRNVSLDKFKRARRPIFNRPYFYHLTQNFLFLYKGKQKYMLYDK